MLIVILGLLYVILLPNNESFSKHMNHKLLFHVMNEDLNKFYDLTLTSNNSFSFDEINNVITFMSKFIDLKSDCAIYYLKRKKDISKNEDFYNNISIHILDSCNNADLNNSKIKTDVRNLLNSNETIRNKNIRLLHNDIDLMHARRVTLSRVPSITRENNLLFIFMKLKNILKKKEKYASFNYEEQIIQAMISTHFKTVLFEEVKNVLLE
jgi:hypothetical protein